MKCLMLVDKLGQRFIGELELATTAACQPIQDGDQEAFRNTLLYILHDDNLISLTKVYEMARAQVQVMTAEGPQVETRFMLVPVGIAGPRPWSVRDPDGFRVIEDDDPIQRAYRDQRANDSGIQLAPANALPQGGLTLAKR